MPDSERLERNRAIMTEMRANQGHLVSGPFAGAPLLILHTTGARSGLRRTSPLRYLADGDRWVVFAANAGRRVLPGWYHNLLAHPDATIEVGTDTVEVTATVATGPERSRLFAAVMAEVPLMADFQRTAPGPIPVVVLTGKAQ